MRLLLRNFIFMFALKFLRHVHLASGSDNHHGIPTTNKASIDLL
jgi:hypothetical protein